MHANFLPYLIPLVVIVGLFLFGMRARRRQAAEESVRAGRIGVGTEVMTTSGLYGTVVARHDDGTVMLSIAQGVEVKWALAALRDAQSVPAQYRTPIQAPGTETGQALDGEVSGGIDGADGRTSST